MEINKIYLGDCYELIKQIPDKSVDLVITDPPYEMVEGGSGGCFGAKKRDYHHEYKTLSRDDHKREGLRISANYNKLKQNLNCICAGFDYSLLDELDRVMKQIHIYIWCNKNQISSLMKHYEDKGCNVDLLVWHKTNPLPACNNKYLSDLEYCVFAREPNLPLNGSYETKSKCYTSGANVDDKKQYFHPTCKPIERLEHFIINSSKEGDLILDPFCGSGSTLIAAKRLKRNYIGFEIEPKWHKVAEERLQGINQKGELNLLDLDYEQLNLFEGDNE